MADREIGFNVCMYVCLYHDSNTIPAGMPSFPNRRVSSSTIITPELTPREGKGETELVVSLSTFKRVTPKGRDFFFFYIYIQQ